jgi:hypothetical protein
MVATSLIVKFLAYHLLVQAEMILKEPGLASLQRVKCPLRVKSGHIGMSMRRPLYPQ